VYLIDTNVISEARKGERADSGDKQIAATALVYDLTLVSRNTADFAQTPVRLLNPFAGAPG
jgi:predicted nucleic acid-binding protein